MGTIVSPLKSDIFEEDIGYRSAVSEELLRKLAASVNAINTFYKLPIGSCMFAHLTEAAWVSESSNCWILADGRNITTTDLGQLWLSEGIFAGPVVNAPDMRGMVPIGINNGRADGKQNTVSPSLGIGGFMAGGVKSHSHISTGVYGAGGAYMMLESGNVGTTTPYPDVYTGTTGQSQNTVNSVGGNWFLKVWRNPQP